VAFEAPTTTELWDALPKSVRDSDEKEGTLFLKRLFYPLEAALARWDGKLAQIPAALHPRTASPAHLELMLPRVGIDDAVSFLMKDRVPADLRKLHLLAMELWRQRYSEEGLLNTLQAIAGSEATYWSWFDMRTVLGEEHAGEAMQLVGTPDMPDGESLSVVRLMDNGRVDEDLVLKLVNLHRPMGEHIDVVLLDFYDLFEGESWRSRWETMTDESADEATLDEDDGRLVFTAGTGERPIIQIAPPSQFKNVALTLRYLQETDGGGIALRVLEGGARYYDIVVEAKDYRPNVLVRDQDGVTLFDQDLLYALPAGMDHVLRVEGVCGATNNLLTIYVDGQQVCYLEHAASPRPTGGFFALTGNGGGTLKVDEVEFTRIPARVARVSPRGKTTQSPNWQRRRR
jgi:hypothetical protein